MSWYENFIKRRKQKETTIIDHLNTHLKPFTHDEKIEHLKAIVPLVCPGVNVSKNPRRAKKAERIEV